MPPNLFVKQDYIRGEYEPVQKKDIKNSVRTDFILKNVYAHLLGIKCDCNSVNKEEGNVLEGVIETVDAFRKTYANTVRGLCSEIGEVTEDTLHSVLLGVSNELFNEGITWGRIIALFVFVGELTVICIARNESNPIVDVMYECFARLVREKLESWIEDHNGWEGITSLALAIQEDNPSKNSNTWAKSLLYGTVRMIGTLALIANSTSNVV